MRICWLELIALGMDSSYCNQIDSHRHIAYHADDHSDSGTYHMIGSVCPKAHTHTQARTFAIDCFAEDAVCWW